jgi:hypothetical protein
MFENFYALFSSLHMDITIFFCAVISTTLYYSTHTLIYLLSHSVTFIDRLEIQSRVGKSFLVGVFVLCKLITIFILF